MLGKLKDLQEAFKKAQQVQEGAQQLQKELELMEIEGKSNDGNVSVVLSGNQEPRRVSIEPAAVEQGAEALSQLVTEAMQAAYAASTETMRQKMEALTGGLNLPGI